MTARDERDERSLDPEDWEAMRRLGHEMVDDMISSLQHVRERPVWQSPPQDVRERLRAPLPQGPTPPRAVYEQFKKDILPYPLGNIHPRFWGWVNGTGTVMGVLADMLAAGMNSNVGAFDQGATLVEAQVIDWCKEMLGYPPGASGLLLSGGSMANLVGLAVARNAKSETDVRAEGMGRVPRPMIVFCSAETHNSVHKAVELLGLGARGLRIVPVNDAFEIDIAALRKAVAEEKQAGNYPFCVVGNAGTVNTGATDDLTALARLCAEEKMWLHVDGAFGALAALSPKLRERVRGLDLADSLAFDLHKWLYMPIEVGCALVRDPRLHEGAFAKPGAYLGRLRGGISPKGTTWFADLGLQLSRGFRALKVWMSLKEHGARRYGEAIEQNVEQARYLAELVERDENLELLAPVPLNVVCFRYRAVGLTDVELDDLNERILVALHESGVAAPSFTRIRGRFAIRVAITNHRSRREDFEMLAGETVRLGGQLRVVSTANHS